MKLLVTYWVWALVAVALLSCNTNTDTVAPVAKISANDPFKNSIVPTQEFTVDAKTDNVVQGNNGTVLVLPQGCFVDADGKPVEGNIKVELAEALKVEDMLASNLTTTANGQLLQTDGMIYFNATANGQQLTVNKDNPVYIEIPTPKKQPDMMVYSGTRDSLGNMTWKNPRKPENYLVTVDLDKLDFLPHGFADSVANNMPFRKYRKATDKLTDSLYYSLSGKSQYDFIDMDKFWKDLFKEFNVNEPLLTEPVKRDSTRIAEPAKGYDEQGGEGHGSHGPSDWECGIDPAIIKTLKSPQYKNTLIATREFETRLKVLFKTCKKGVIDLYFNNLDKNMYEIDSMAAIKLAGTPYESDFITFKNLRSGKVKNGDKHSKLLQGFYERKLKEVKDKLEEANNKFKEEVKKTTADIEAVKNDYKEVLVKRESYRMETYGFIATETGWINIDNGTIEKDWAPQTMELFVEGGKGYERTYGYVIFTSIKSLSTF
ncbi:MAG: hypothetical protein M0D57_20795 [Sphingobacteriales bacterium JAD_PAG50586_3]|nr:MAG: hypothetical protein M0D57_20795 [Sphingobacteriales bacterium JAD_PAG50586_3]